MTDTAKRASEREKWETVHALLEPWRKVWEGDQEKYVAEFPEWMVYAAAELFAHDLCDAWSWNDYIKAATVIIDRHHGVHVRHKELSVKAENAALREEVERLRSHLEFIYESMCSCNICPEHPKFLTEPQFYNYTCEFHRRFGDAPVVREGQKGSE